MVSVAPLHAWFAPVSSVGWERMAAGAICGGGLAMLVGAGWPEAVVSAATITLLAFFPVPAILNVLAFLTPPAVLAAVVVPLVVLARAFRAEKKIVVADPVGDGS